MLASGHFSPTCLSRRGKDLSNCVINSSLLALCLLVCLRHVYFPPGRQCSTPADPYGLAYGSASVPPLYCNTLTHTHTQTHTEYVETLHNHNTSTQHTGRACHKNPTKTLLESTCGVSVGGSEQNPTFRLYVYGSEMKRCISPISLIPVDLSRSPV